MIYVDDFRKNMDFFELSLQRSFFKAQGGLQKNIFRPPAKIFTPDSTIGKSPVARLGLTVKCSTKIKTMYSSTRKVRSNGRTIVGQLHSEKRKVVQFESALEEEFLYILDFDPDVKCIYDQPVQIRYKDENGKERLYTPDFLVEYNNRKPVLFEVKSQEYLRKNKDDVQRISKAGTEFAKKMLWEFRVITDKEIKIIYCDNARFLRRFQAHKTDLVVVNDILKTLSAGVATPNSLIRQLSTDPARWPDYISAIWALVLNGKIACNLFEKIHMETPIRIPEPGEIKKLQYPYVA